VRLLPQKNNLLAVSSLLAGALVWGLIWYPYRALEAAGVGGALASLLTYALALLPGLLLLRGRASEFMRSPGLLAAISLSAGWCNLAYVLAMIHGEVMQVMLLFYLAPLWTVVLAALLLGERPGPVGYVVVALAGAGAMIMLWQPGASLPLPRGAAQWLGLSSGMAFALSNVLSRKARHIDVSVKAVSVWAGVSLLALPIVFAVEQPVRALQELEAPGWALLVLVAAVIFSVNLAVQYGLTHTPANRAIVIFLSELVFAALAAYWLAFEAMNWRQWLGGAMVVAASLCSGRLAQAPPKSAPA
jgi:drug/metabolite transporter (DMT)-like permease